MAAVGPVPSARGYRLSRRVRIRKSNEIRDLVRKGRLRRTESFVFHFAHSPATQPRVGWIVPRHGHSIVERNRLKRRIREIARTEVLPELRAAGRRADLLIRALPSAYALPFERIREQMRSTTKWLCSNEAF